MSKVVEIIPFKTKLEQAGYTVRQISQKFPIGEDFVAEVGSTTLEIQTTYAEKRCDGEGQTPWEIHIEEETQNSRSFGGGRVLVKFLLRDFTQSLGLVGRVWSGSRPTLNRFGLL